MKVLRIKSDETIRMHRLPLPNPYRNEPGGERTLACQWIESVNAWRAFLVELELAIARALRRLPFVD